MNGRTDGQTNKWMNGPNRNSKKTSALKVAKSGCWNTNADWFLNNDGDENADKAASYDDDSCDESAK